MSFKVSQAVILCRHCRSGSFKRHNGPAIGATDSTDHQDRRTVAVDGSVRLGHQDPAAAHVANIIDGDAQPTQASDFHRIAN
jgi:hypothetical protein